MRSSGGLLAILAARPRGASSRVWRGFRVLAITRPVSGSRPPPRSIPSEQPERLDELEELGDDAIIAQQAVVHAPRPRANVAEESRSVVITDHHRSGSEPPRAPRKSSGEATLVIRDRRALDDLRSQIERGRNKANQRRRPLYWWGALGLAAFVLGGVVAFLATDGRAEGQTAVVPAATARVEAQAQLGPRVVSPPDHAEPATPSVRLDELPVEPPRKH